MHVAAIAQTSRCLRVRQLRGWLFQQVTCGDWFCMSYRIYLDESGTHTQTWLLIGALFVPDHAALHPALCKVKDDLVYFNKSSKRNARYKETHLTDFRSPRDVLVAQRWFDLFIQHNCFYRCIAIDWAQWDSSYFGGPFEPEALKRRRGYKKWAEMLLHPELRNPSYGPIYHAKLYLDRLLIAYGYDVLDHLEDRFTRNYEGQSPYIDEFQHTDSWRDANQCLQLCDLLTGCIFQSLQPSQQQEKLQTRDALIAALQAMNIRDLSPKFWKQYEAKSLRTHFPKFNIWYWRPQK